MLFDAQRLLRAELASLASRDAVSKWVAGLGPLPSVETWRGAHDDLVSALAIAPDSPDLHDAMGDVFMVAGQMAWQDEARRTSTMKQAVAHYQNAAKLRPAEAQTWAAMAAALAAAGEHGEPMQSAWLKALTLGPNEAHVQPMLMHTALATWQSATPDMRTWATRTYENASSGVRSEINAMAKPFGLAFRETDEGKQ